MAKVNTRHYRRYKIMLAIAGVGIVLFILSYFVIPFFTQDTYVNAIDTKGTSTQAVLEQEPELPKVKHIETPLQVKAIYMSSCVAGTPTFRDSLVKIADTTEINSIVIDIKDFSGTLSFTPADPSLKEFVSKKCGASDMKEFIELLHSKNIYVIGRVTTFQDPYFTTLRPELAVKRASDGGVWKDRKGISYIDPGSEEAWKHVVAIATSSHDIGFDEINFDYIRFPSDGNMKDIAFPWSGTRPKPEVLESFFKYLREHMEGIPISADLFGMTTTSFDDLNIGQVLERALPYFDFIAPMVYPSHYPPNFNGWKDPNLYPYDLIHFVMKRGVERTVATTSPIDTLESVRVGTSTPAVYTKTAWDKNKLRPWIQDFNYGGIYGPKEVKAQIKAVYDVGLTSWLIWSPSNKYTLSALESEN